MVIKLDGAATTYEPSARIGVSWEAGCLHRRAAEDCKRATHGLYGTIHSFLNHRDFLRKRLLPDPLLGA